MFKEKSMNFWNHVYFIFLAIAAGATIVSILAAFFYNRKSSEAMAQMKVEISIANDSAAKANLRAVEIEKQNIELRLKFANRRLTEEQHRILVEELSKNPGSFNMEVMPDPESGLFAADILKTFEDAGWKVEGKVFQLGETWIGINVFLTDDPVASIIEKAFEKANIPYGIGNSRRKKATIMVGGKPPVF